VSTPKSSNLDRLIPPEIKDDPFYSAIERYAAHPTIRTILEIGASSGEGSTEAIVHGMLRNPGKPTLFTLEISIQRFEALRARYASNTQVNCYNASSVPLDGFESEDRVREFYGRTPSALNKYPLERVIGWLRADVEYVRENGIDTDGIERIRREHGIDRFDIVLIDGSEFTGRADLERVYGARYLLLDDINSLKNLENVERLSRDPQYILTGADLTLRAGCAIFERRS
jgi:hypothetical protein